MGVIAHQLSVSPGYFHGWIDFNGDGDWYDADEQIFRNVRLQDGTNQLTFNVPPGVSGGGFARFRFAFERDLSPDRTGLRR